MDMVLEIANIEVKPGLESDFEASVSKARPIFQKAEGCRSMHLRRNIENPSLYHLFVEWDRIEDHTDKFRNSEGFQEWRKLVGHCFSKTPEVSHNEVVDL